MEPTLNLEMSNCQLTLKAIADVSYLLGGKWKIPIIAALMVFERLRYMDLLRKLDGIGTKMLSKELQELEMHQLVSRTVVNTRPVVVEYALTPHGKSLSAIINEMIKWGFEHRAVVIK